MKDPTGVAECQADDVLQVVAALWPQLYAPRTVSCETCGRRCGAYVRPLVDGHWRVGISFRLLGPPCAQEATRAAALQALELLQQALEDRGFETTRTGNEYQTGRLVLGWSLTADGTRLVDLPKDHPAWAERRERLLQERTRERGGACG